MRRGFGRLTTVSTTNMTVFSASRHRTNFVLPVAEAAIAGVRAEIVALSHYEERGSQGAVMENGGEPEIKRSNRVAHAGISLVLRREMLVIARSMSWPTTRLTGPSWYSQLFCARAFPQNHDQDESDVARPGIFIHVYFRGLDSRAPRLLPPRMLPRTAETESKTLSITTITQYLLGRRVLAGKRRTSIVASVTSFIR